MFFATFRLQFFYSNLEYWVSSGKILMRVFMDMISAEIASKLNTAYFFELIQ